MNDKLIDRLKQNYDDGEILRLRIGNNEVDLMVEWNNFPPNERLSEFEHINIQANRIAWENLPNISNLKTELEI